MSSNNFTSLNSLVVDNCLIDTRQIRAREFIYISINIYIYFVCGIFCENCMKKNSSHKYKLVACGNAFFSYYDFEPSQVPPKGEKLSYCLLVLFSECIGLCSPDVFFYTDRVTGNTIVVDQVMFAFTGISLTVFSYFFLYMLKI